ncbi:sodium:proton exchanger [Candidatus Entotheonella serta]|nr:sodium:proton exchanger [Candidatus Entotheonella serta]
MVTDLLTILFAGLVAGLLCKRFGISLLVGYLLMGVVLGDGALGWVSDDNHEIEYLAEAGVFLLLFAIGLEFSPHELGRLGRHLLVGGSAQMLLVSGPMLLVLWAAGLSWQPATLLAAAFAFSSTVLVFKSLAEWGQTATPHGRRAISVLLFQDAALIPLLLVVPLLTGSEQTVGLMAYLKLGGASVAFVASVIGLRAVLTRWVIPSLANYRSPELVVLMTLVVLGGVTLLAHAIRLAPAVGAFASGLAFSDTRWTKQIDALVLPFRETFTAVFFVSLGLLFDPSLLQEEPMTLLVSLMGLILLKTLAAAVALRLTGLVWKSALGTGIGLAHVGEFAFVLVVLGWESGLISSTDYHRLVCLALGSLVLTPMLLKTGLRWAETADHQEGVTEGLTLGESTRTAIVIGIGPIGQNVAHQFHHTGWDVWLIDQSSVNLHPYTQRGFHTIAGDATDDTILNAAHAAEAGCIAVCVPDDEVAIRLVQTLRGMNPRGQIVVRCRYTANERMLLQAGANRVVSEEAQASDALRRILLDVEKSQPTPHRTSS